MPRGGYHHCSRRRQSAPPLPLLLLWSLLGAVCIISPAVLGAAVISDVATSATPLYPGGDFTATWSYASDDGEPATTGDLRVYEISLEPCAAAGACECNSEGNSLAIALCDDTALGCVDSDGSYDLTVPSTAEPGVYLMRVSLKDDPSAVFACTYGFSVEQEEEEEEEPELSVSGSSSADDAWIEVFEVPSVAPGEAVTAKWLYRDGSEGDDEDDGEGAVGSAGSFAVDLYSCDGDEACANGR